MTKFVLGFYALALALIWWSSRGKPEARTPALVMSLGLGAAVLSLFAIFFVGKGAMVMGAIGLLAFIGAYAVTLRGQAKPGKGSRPKW